MVGIWLEVWDLDPVVLIFIGKPFGKAYWIGSQGLEIWKVTVGLVVIGIIG